MIHDIHGRPRPDLMEYPNPTKATPLTQYYIVHELTAIRAAQLCYGVLSLALQSAILMLVAYAVFE